MNNCSDFNEAAVQTQPISGQLAGKWITVDDQVQAGQWLNFRKTFSLPNRPKTAKVKLVAESKYWLWINGQLVVFEGQVKNGPAPQSGYFDELDIAAYLKAGLNTLAILVNYFGKDGYGVFSIGHAGLCFAADIDGQKLISDETWRVTINPAYHEPIPQKDRSYRIAEPDINYHAVDTLQNWTQGAYDDHDWPHAVSKNLPYKKLWPRPIPLLKVGEVQLFTPKDDQTHANFEVLANSGSDVQKYVIQNPTNQQGTSYLKVIAKENKRIDIYTDTWKEVAGHGDSVRHTYYTKNGEQEFEALGWFNGYRVFFEIPRDVQVLALGFRPSGYNVAATGTLESSDSFLNKLTKKSFDTLYVTMRDIYMDCPDRERAQWVGDAVNEMQMAFYAMDKSASLLFKKTLNQVLGFQHYSGSLPTTVPNGLAHGEIIDANGNRTQSSIDANTGGSLELPAQSLALVSSFWQYYLYSGDRQPLEDGYQAILKYLKLWQIDAKTGMVNHRTGTWDWDDWGANADARLIDQCWYYEASRQTIKVIKLVAPDDQEDLDFLNHHMQLIATHFEENFWSEKYHAYYYETENKAPDDRANALAVYTGLYQGRHQPALKRTLETTFNASPYMEKIVLEALYLLDDDLAAEKRMRTRYQAMVEDEYPTLWEFWQANQGTRNHAWSGGPLIMMYRYALGVTPLSPAYQRIQIRPHLGDLRYVHGTICTAAGKVKVAIDRDQKETALKVELPDKVTELVLRLPKSLINHEVKIDGISVFEEGKPSVQLPNGLTFSGETENELTVSIQRATLTGNKTVVTLL